MLDLNSFISLNNNIQQYISSPNNTWQTWVKPRGCQYIYIIAIGGGSSGGCGLNTSTTSGGGAGGGSGAQSYIFIPAIFLPDILYIQPGIGGQQPLSLISGATGVAGSATYVCIEPNNIAAMTLLYASGGLTNGAASTSTGGAIGTPAPITTFSNCPLSCRGITNFFPGVSGSTGGNSGLAGTILNIPTTGSLVTGGAGGAGTSGTTSASGGSIIGAGLGNDIFPTLSGGIASSGAISAGFGQGKFISKNYNMFYGGAGGGSANATAGGQAGNGGNGSFGCGGGGAGGSTTTNAVLARPGDGGSGIVIIISFV
jgi:hypothetical protein